MLFAILFALFWCLFLYCMKTCLEQADRNAGADNHSGSRTITDSSPSLLMCLQIHPSRVLQRKTAYLIIHILLIKLFSAQIWKKNHLNHLRPEHWMEDAAVFYIYNINFVLLHFQVEEETASFHNPQQAVIYYRLVHNSMSRGLHEFIKGTTHHCQPSRGFMHSQICSFVALCRSDCSSTALNELFCSITAFVCFVPSDRAQVGHQSSPWTEIWTAGGLVKVISLNASNWTCHHFTITYITSILFFFF